MKIFAHTLCDGLMIKPDSALLRNNDDFYIPSWASDLRCEAGLYFKISKIGKAVGLKFADRYLSQAGLALMFYMSDAENVVDRHCFDKSLAISKMVDISLFYEGLSELDLRINDSSMKLEIPIKTAVCEHLVEATKRVACKIGDLLFIPLVALGKVEQHTSFAYKAGDRSSLEFIVK